ncbi:MAG TPA: LpqB family beta-propeller domain-containing protein [Thermoanaerobaculia bacterium]|nr:LpqB family beta-propeller domain-containing protein [Thermoanaerobaculia bacterium]
MRAFLLALLLAAPAIAQSPAADWRTIETPHFRVHYPAESEAWAKRSAARLESIRERVAAEIGYTPPETVDVLVSDPVADANGMALPILGWPRLVLWTSPPGPESVIGHYSDWAELLLVHEEAHLVHLLRPSRNPWRQLVSRVLPVSPIALGSPRWVTEGYATVVEGRLTASGRPNSDLRAAILRRWARAGKLPGYGQLDSDSRSWIGMSMAYLVGSAYLEWLEERAGPGSLRNLWARMTARQARSFDDAFEGVFGDSPSDLYDRFRAEVTGRALETERRIGEVREGELWQDLSWNVGDPAVSPDGKRLALVLGSRDLPSQLVVLSTEPDEKAEEEWEKRRREILERDPEDVPAERNRPLPREPLHTLSAWDGTEPTMPRWMPDGNSLLFVRFEPDPEGFLHPDLFLWIPEDGNVRRVTREADLRYPDPSPDGTWAIAVRHRNGTSQLVRTDLTTGEVREITPPTVEEVYDRPRISPDGSRVAFVRHRQGAWRLVIRDLASGEEQTLAPPREGTIATPAWGQDTIYAVVGDRGFIDVWAFPLDGGEPGPVTRTTGAAFAPAPAPDGSSLFFLSLEPGGLDLRRIDPGRAADLPDLPTELAPVIRPPSPVPPEPFATAEVSAARPYGFGRQELLPLIGGGGGSSGGSFELGVRGGDVVGRLDWLALGALSGSGWAEGGALAAAWRGWPVEAGFHLFQAEELDLDRHGAEISARWNRTWSGGALRIDGRTLFGQVDSLDQEIASLSAGTGLVRRRGSWRLQTVIAANHDAGNTDGDVWSRSMGWLRLNLGSGDSGLTLDWRRGTSSDVRHAFDLFQLGGPETSLLPESILLGRISVPALPLGTLLGEEHEGQRAELVLDLLPAPLFFERHRLWSEGDPKGEWLSLVGLEWRWATGPIPLGRVPALDLRLGVARVLDDPSPGSPLQDETRWWLTTVWRP